MYTAWYRAMAQAAAGLRACHGGRQSLHPDGGSTGPYPSVFYAHATPGAGTCGELGWWCSGEEIEVEVDELASCNPANLAGG
jgi:hypothetical protein